MHAPCRILVNALNNSGTVFRPNISPLSVPPPSLSFSLADENSVSQPLIVPTDIHNCLLYNATAFDNTIRIMLFH